MAVDPQKVLQRYQSGIGAAGQKWLDGIMGMTSNPAAKAASPQGMANWLAGVQASQTKRQASLSRVSLADIQNAAQTYGMANYTGSATKAASKYGRKLPALTALWSAQRAAVSAIPKTPGTNNQARWQAAVQLAMAAKGKI